MKYTDVQPNHSQYEGQTFNYGEITDAIYVKPLLDSDKGNKYIAALPLPPDKRTIMKMNIYQSAGYNTDNSKKSDAQKLIEISNLQTFRVPLPSVYQLWTNIYQCLEQSYSRRQILKSNLQTKTVLVHGDPVSVDSKLVSPGDSAIIGFYMIGQSGCGKTSALHTALNYYPKVIRHTNSDGTKTIQIPYLFVTCAPNSNFRVLYTNIGKQLDLYLGNPDHECENEIVGGSRRTLGEMLKRVESMIERYAIGLIVFDEVQLINFANNKENSFNSLMTMANETLVALGMAGTNEAINSIAQIPQIARRFGLNVPCDNYITDEHYFNTVMNQLERYQWFDERISFTDSMKHEIFMQSHGIIAYVVLIYMMISMDYVNQTPKPEVNLEYIRNVINKYFSLIKQALENRNISSYEREIILSQEVHKVSNTLTSIADKATEAEDAAMINQLLENNSSESELENQVTQRIKSFVPNRWNDEHIREVFRVVYNNNQNADVQTLSEKTLQRLFNGRTDRRRYGHSSKKDSAAVETETMRSYVMNDIGDPNNPLG